MDKPIILISAPPVHSQPPASIRGAVSRVASQYGQLLDTALVNRGRASLSNFRHAFSPQPIAHYGILCIAQALKQAGIPAHYVWGISVQEILSKVYDILGDSSDDALIGINGLTPNWHMSKQIIVSIKQKFSNTQIVVGGPHVTYAIKHQGLEPLIDVVVQFAGEHAFLEIAKTFLSGGKLTDIDSNHIIHRENTEAISNSSRTVEPIPDQWQVPDYDLLSFDDLIKIASFVVGKRGCERRCPFCIEGRYWPKQTCSKSADLLVDEIMFLSDVGRQTLVHVADSTFFLDIDYAGRVLNLLSRQNTPPALSINAHLEDLKKPEVITLLSNPLIVEVLIGIETLSEPGQRIIGRRMTFEEIFAILEAVRATGVPLISVYTMMGLPLEQKTDISQSARKIESLIKAGLVDCTIPKFFVPYPGTTFYEYPDRYDIEIDDKDYQAFERWHLPRPIRGQIASEQDILNEMLYVLEAQFDMTALKSKRMHQS